MTLDEAIKHCEENAQEQDKLCKRYDDASGYTRSHNKEIRTNDAKKCERCAAEHRQLAEWLKDYKRLKEPREDATLKDIFCMGCEYKEQETKWIPVSERLPETGKEVITCGAGGLMEIQSLEDDYWETQYGNWSAMDEVIAWMPLPEPYKEESEVRSR